MPDRQSNPGPDTVRQVETPEQSDVLDHERSDKIHAELRERYTEDELVVLERVHEEWVRAFDVGGSANARHMLDFYTQKVCPTWQERRELWVAGLARYSEMKAIRLAEDFIIDLTAGQPIYGPDRYREFENHHGVLEQSRELERELALVA